MRLNRLFASLVIFLVSSLSFAQPSLRTAIQTSTHGELPVSGVYSLVETQVRTEKKSVLLAIGYSLLLPGLGDLYADNFRRGLYYFGADAALWMTYGGFRTYGSWLKQDALTLASQRSGANFDGKGDQFAVDVGNFDNVDDYNEAKLRNRQFDLIYDPNSNFAWQWSSADERLNYRHLRIRGDAVIRNSQFVVGALVINRIIAAISAAQSTAAYNRSLQATSTWRLKADVKGGVLTTQTFELTLTREF
ncbi:MAG: hypothetical protein NTU47_17660 [Ignavibacteriales bacterium]|nr:hypothetical protein [Ignavibacteriales bacterium]